jgi:hypothetical protein
MSVESKLEASQQKISVFDQLDERERILLQMFRLLDREKQQDIIRFLEVLLSAS